ncbi:MAG: hypothetical protein KIS81_07120 [Maricaulaceae bacterium]|nr:hypothetical protein [Maricaulaceae bacterium]
MRLPVSAVAAAAAAALSATAPSWAEIRVERTGEAWRVSAEGERLSEVLSALSAEAGFRLAGTERLVANPPVEVSLEAPLADVLYFLLRDRDYALVYGETPETQNQLQRLVVLSGRAGGAPDESHRPAPLRLPDQRPLSSDDAARVAAMLQRQAMPLVMADAGDRAGYGPTAGGAPDGRSGTGGGDNGGGNGDGGGNDGGGLDDDTQAQLAEATRRAHADLQALVNALRQHEGQRNDR